MPPVSFTGWELGPLAGASACPAVIDYFTRSIPATTLDFGHFRWLSPAGLHEENIDLIPGSEMFSHGIVTIAATNTGDAIAVDVSDGRVYLVSHEKFEHGMLSPGWKADFSGFEAPLPVTRANIVTTCEGGWTDIPSALKSLLEDVAG